MADLRILAFQNPEFKILADFMILAFHNPEFKILTDFKILAFHNLNVGHWRHFETSFWKQKFLFVFDKLTRNTVLNRVIETFRFEDEI